VKRERNGFTLIETCIVIIISGLLLAAALKAFNIYVSNQQIEQTKDRLDEIKDALNDYVTTNGYYPCPARIDAAPNTAAFGTATNCGGAAPAGTSDVDGRGGRKVRIGGLPVRTLALTDTYDLDGWDRRFTYAVTRDMAKDAASFHANEGAIAIQDINGNPVVNGTAHYALISHGPDGRGAYGAGGGLFAACGASGKDAANCSNSAAAFVYSEDRATASGAQHYDDFLLYSQKLPATGLPSCKAGEVVTSDGAKLSCVALPGAPKGGSGTGAIECHCCDSSSRVVCCSGQNCWNLGGGQ
jgi:prepilin-type N-terminal cleavage/methylation domain-containing protein